MNPYENFVQRVLAERGGVQDPNMGVDVFGGGVIKGGKALLSGKSLRGGKADPQGTGLMEMLKIIGTTKNADEAVEEYLKRFGSRHTGKASVMLPPLAVGNEGNPYVLGGQQNPMIWGYR